MLQSNGVWAMPAVPAPPPPRPSSGAAGTDWGSSQSLHSAGTAQGAPPLSIVYCPFCQLSTNNSMHWLPATIICLRIACFGAGSNPLWWAFLAPQIDWTKPVLYCQVASGRQLRADQLKALAALERAFLNDNRVGMASACSGIPEVPRSQVLQCGAAAFCVLLVLRVATSGVDGAGDLFCLFVNGSCGSFRYHSALLYAGTHPPLP